jgi:hypothetical protein
MNITYLLGAGASFEALPLIEVMPEALDSFAKDFDPGKLKNLTPMTFITDGNIAKSYLIKLDSDKSQQKRYFNLMNKFHEDILWLKTESGNHNSVDTFAKKLSLQEDYRSLKRLKLVLSCFFFYIQTKKFDKRYDSFFASILDNLTNIPKNLKVLSWNYDSQLELAFKRFSKSTMEATKRKLNIYSKGNEKPDYLDLSDFSVFKVNGTTNAINYELLSDFEIDETDLVEDFLELYETSTYQKFNSDMSFAWENYNEESDFYKSLKASILETDILIVIGYSFPFFNRKVDKYMLDSMPKLKKVYVQDPFNAKDIIEKMKGLIPRHEITMSGISNELISFESKIFKDQFFIPIEF